MTTRAASLHALLRRMHLGFALGIVALVGAALAGPGLATLRVYTEHDLRLIGRAIGYTLEAAVVFDDRDAAGSELLAIAQTEDVRAVTVTRRDGQVLARWEASGNGWRSAVRLAAAALLFASPASVPILHDGSVVGQVEVWSGTRTLLPFLFYGALGILACQLLGAAGALYLSRHLQRRIVQPVQLLAEVAGVVQRDRTFGRRVPRSDVKELDELGEVFNRLLAELDAWHVGITGENERLAYEATHDGLTALSNRAYFEARLARAVAEADAGQGSCAVVLMDCDLFKQVNDIHGHAAGDMVLVAVAARLREQVRKQDLVARLGGDEFAVLIAPCPPPATLDDLLRRVAEAMQLPIPILDAQTVMVGLSTGVARYPADAADAQTLLHCADLAMYKDKNTRRLVPEKP